MQQNDKSYIDAARALLTVFHPGQDYTTVAVDRTCIECGSVMKAHQSYPSNPYAPHKVYCSVKCARAVK